MRVRRNDAIRLVVVDGKSGAVPVDGLPVMVTSDDG